MRHAIASAVRPALIRQQAGTVEEIWRLAYAIADGTAQSQAPKTVLEVIEGGKGKQ